MRDSLPLSIQIIFIAAHSFIYTVITAYISYRYIIQPSDELKKTSSIYTQHWIFGITPLLVAIHGASRVDQEVMNLFL